HSVSSAARPPRIAAATPVRSSKAAAAEADVSGSIRTPARWAAALTRSSTSSGPRGQVVGAYPVPVPVPSRPPPVPAWGSAGPEVPMIVEFDDPAAVLSVSGEIDEDSTETLRLAIEKHSLSYTRGLTLDLTGATYVPSVAVGVLVRAGQSFAESGANFEL